MSSRLKNYFRPIFRSFSARFLENSEWSRRQYDAPSPRLIKRQVLLRNGFSNAIWVETGTFLGETTDFLSKNAKMVYSVEPEPNLFERAQRKFSRSENIKILNGTSELVFPQLLPTLSGAVNFWLDGHYSAGITFKGQKDTPVVEELLAIEANLVNFSEVCVLIDDLRCFKPHKEEYAHYPTVNHLVDWAGKNMLNWHIEHDIFVAIRNNKS